MVFLGKLIAWALVGFGAFTVGISIWIAQSTPTMVENAHLSARYLAAANSGEGMDRGLIMLAVGIAFGLLARIAGR